MKIRKFLIQPTAIIFLIWMVISDRSGIGAMTLLAAVLHECGHLLAAKAMHIPMRSLYIDLLGARLDIAGRIISYKEEWLLSASGPLASLVFSAIGAFFWQETNYAVAFSCASFLLGILNLLPIKSFDGGRMLECALRSLTTLDIAHTVMRGCTFVFLFLLWAAAVYFLLRANDGLSLFCFSLSLLGRFFDTDVKINKCCS